MISVHFTAIDNLGQVLGEFTEQLTLEAIPFHVEAIRNALTAVRIIVDIAL